MTDPEDGQESWHLDKKVPIAFIIAIAVQTGGFIYWVGSTSTRIDVLERAMLSSAPQAERVVRIETKVEALKDSLTEIKAILRPAPTR